MKRLAVLTMFLLAGCTTPPKPVALVRVGPHVFYSGVALYMNQHPNGLLVSKDRFLSCKEALDDTRSAISRTLVPGEAPEGATAIGVCIPVPIFDPSDLVPNELF